MATIFLAASSTALAPFSGAVPAWLAMPCTRRGRMPPPLRAVMISPPGRPLSTVKAAPAAQGLPLQKVHRLPLGQGVGGLLVAQQHQAKLAAVIARVQQRPDHIQGDHQPTLAVVDAGAVHLIALQPPGPRRGNCRRGGRCPDAPAAKSAAGLRTACGRPGTARCSGAGTSPSSYPARRSRCPGGWQGGLTAAASALGVSRRTMVSHSRSISSRQPSQVRKYRFLHGRHNRTSLEAVGQSQNGRCEPLGLGEQGGDGSVLVGGVLPLPRTPTAQRVGMPMEVV